MSLKHCLTESSVTAVRPQIASSSSSLATNGGGASVGGDSSNNQQAPESELQLQPTAQADSRAADGNEDSTATARTFEGEPWFAKLPPELQKAIKARSRVEAPRGYEERLRRYFESID